ncbi:hypothetical protein [Lysinibacillus sp. BW-2-10]|uniref:hypothetical protein n=1 Tax=Lysinibacillus sp. BW-2-10 TaxID=2590030 RepID=UPI00117C3F64|nr:hypothetical protein [Lysinibacillus sp. BW-2-10]TSI02537.1 hypothetical protein FJQ64_18250 [Lysinibacillus sp. BW-2-10]
MKLIHILYRWFIKIQHKIQHISLFFSLIIAEVFILFADFSFLMAIPEIGLAIIMGLIIIYFWRKIKMNKKYKMFIGIINSLVFWNYTFIWVYPYPITQNH